MSSSFKIAILLNALTALILIIVRRFGGHQIIIASIFALVMNGTSLLQCSYSLLSDDQGRIWELKRALEGYDEIWLNCVTGRKRILFI
jgi:hypothetical protein